MTVKTKKKGTSFFVQKVCTKLVQFLLGNKTYLFEKLFRTNSL